MAFEPDKWADGPEGETPVTAAELNRIEAAGAAKAAQGPKGDKGDTGAAGKDGAKGDKGEKGDPGSDAENPFTSEEVTALKALAAADA